MSSNLTLQFLHVYKMKCVCIIVSSL